MLVCNSCNRHYRPEDGRCPFCGTSLQTISAPTFGIAAALVLGLAMFACGKSEDGEDEASPTGTEMGETGTDSVTDTNESGGADYGGPDTSVEDTSNDTTDSGGADYGGPDTGTDTTTDTSDTGTADYGGPDTTGADTGTDTGTSDAGTADYGGAPAPDPEFDI